MRRRRRRLLGLLGAASCVSFDDFWQSRIIGSAKDIHLIVCPGWPLRLACLINASTDSRYEEDVSLLDIPRI